jgi:hypothetical protein
MDTGCLRGPTVAPTTAFVTAAALGLDAAVALEPIASAEPRAADGSIFTFTAVA